VDKVETTRKAKPKPKPTRTSSIRRAPKCYLPLASTRSIQVGRLSRVVVVVRAKGKPAKRVTVLVTGAGLEARARTNAHGRAVLALHPSRSGLLTVKLPGRTSCRSLRLGAFGVFEPPVTG
jgi:hypothetical protein